MAKKGTYYSSISWTEDGKEFSMATQLYQMGLYMVINQGSRMVSQGGTEPPALGRKQKKLIAKLESEGIEVRLGPKVTATDETGYWEVVPDPPEPHYKPDEKDKRIYKLLVKNGIPIKKARDFALTGCGGIDIFNEKEIETIKEKIVPIWDAENKQRKEA